MPHQPPSNDNPNNNETESIIAFPDEFQIKVIGAATDEFEIAVLSIVRETFPNLKETAIQTRHSKDKNYLAMSITVYVEKKSELDEVYRKLSASQHVMFAL